MIVFDSVTKKYGNIKALDGLCMSVEKGEVLGLIGHNGAGKTTSLKILATLLRQDSGTITIDGANIWNDIEATRGMIGYMPDFFGVYEEMNVVEYMEYYADLFRLSKGEKDDMIPKLLEIVKLEDKSQSPVNGLSRGMKQRLCLARTLINDPRILLLDEPASGMDPSARIHLKDIIRRLASLGKTIIISSHILSDISEICTDICIIDKGALRFKGKIADIWSAGMSSTRNVKFGYLNLDLDVERLLLKMPEISGFSCENGKGDIYFDVEEDCDRCDEKLSAILERMISDGVRVTSFKMDETTLEEKYLDILSEYGEVQNA